MRAVLTIVVGWCLLCGVHSQRPQIGFCNTYQTTQDFDQNFITKIQESEEGYSFLLTSARSDGCQKISFFPNGTFFYDFIDVTSGRTNATGSYQMQPFSFTRPASIRLSSLPFGELGSVLGTVSFNVLIAQEDFLVLLSCINIGLIRTQQVHVLIPESASASAVASDVNATVQDLQVPLASRLQEVPQTCVEETGTDEALLLLNRLYSRLGFFPSSIAGSGLGGALFPGFYPVVDNSNIVSGVSPEFARLAQAGFPVFGVQPQSGAQSSIFSQAATPTELKAVVPQHLGQHIAQAPSAVQFGVHQFPSPTKAFPGVRPEADSIGSLSQFKVHDPAVASGLIAPTQQFQYNNPSVPVGSLQPGTYNVFY